MTLYFVRHGETEYNKQRQLMGQKIDAPLDSQGLQQAHLVAARLPQEFSMVYSSPLQRAAQTALVIADFFDKNIEISQELKERDFGSLSGKTWEQIEQETGSKLSQADADLQYDYRDFGGESAEQVKERLLSFLETVKSKHQNDTVVVVTHFGIIALMNSLYPRTEMFDLSNSSVHRFEI